MAHVGHRRVRKHVSSRREAPGSVYADIAANYRHSRSRGEMRFKALKWNVPYDKATFFGATSGDDRPSSQNICAKVKLTRSFEAPGTTRIRKKKDRGNHHRDALPAELKVRKGSNNVIAERQKRTCDLGYLGQMKLAGAGAHAAYARAALIYTCGTGVAGANHPRSRGKARPRSD